MLFCFRIWPGSISGENFNYESICRKTDAAVAFSLLLEEYATADKEVIERLKYRAKYLSYQMYASGTLLDLLRGCFYMIRSGNRLFSRKWIFLMLGSSIKKKISFLIHKRSFVTVS